jgi:hypothetical protein
LYVENSSAKRTGLKENNIRMVRLGRRRLRKQQKETLRKMARGKMKMWKRDIKTIMTWVRVGGGGRSLNVT